MLNFFEWVNLRESVSVYVKDLDYEQNIGDLDTLANWLRSNIVDPIWNKLNDEEKQTIIDGGSYAHGVITPDGGYYSGGDPVISFYTEGWSPENVEKIIQGIKYFLDDRKIKYGPLKKEKSGMYEGDVYRIHILHNKNEVPHPEPLNMTNEMASLIFSNILDIDDLEQPINVREIKMKLDQVTPEMVSTFSSMGNISDTPNEAPNIYRAEVSPDRLQRHINGVKEIVQWAIDNHYDEIYLA